MFRTFMRPRPSGGFLAAAAVLGARIAAGPRRAERPKTGDAAAPDWLSELDEHEDDRELSLALHGELGEVLRARATGTPSAVLAPSAFARTAAARSGCGRRGSAARGRRGRPCP